MASVLFSTIGQAVGGPLGAAVGAAVGSTVDGALQGRGRARPGDILVQRAAYGEAFPRLYGTSRQAGVLLWALPMSMGGGGKGGDRPAYVTSFAIALSSRAILDIGRIWADGREIRNAEGRFETETNFRIHSGSGIDSVDAAIVAAEGIGNAPAYLGLAYVVFEDFPLAAFGNRVPNLSFEVIADAPHENSGHWLKDLAQGAGVEVQHTAEPHFVTGYSAGQSLWRDDVKALARVSNLFETYPEGGLVLAGADRFSSIPLDQICSPDANGSAFGQRRTIATGDRPSGFIVNYFDPEREYQAGSQHAARGTAARVLSSSEPVTSSASVARTLANHFLRRSEAAVAMLHVTLSWRWCEISVGTIVQFEGQFEQWRVVRKEIEGMRLHLSCELHPSQVFDGGRLGASGRSLSAEMIVAEPTEIEVFEMPMNVAGKGGGGIWLSSSGRAGWRGAEISWAMEGGDWTISGTVSQPLVRGTLVAPLESGSEQLWDNKSVLELLLDEEDHWLESRSREAVLAGTNFLRVGGELLQYSFVDPLGQKRFRLQGLLRGRFGTGYANGHHPAGTRIEKFEPSKVLFQSMQTDMIGQTVIVRALGRGDVSGKSVAELKFSGIGYAPLGVCHLKVTHKANGDFALSWQARDRKLFEWTNELPVYSSGFTCVISNNIRGLTVKKFASENYYVYSKSAQINDFGEALQLISAYVISEGEGPKYIRTSTIVGNS